MNRLSETPSTDQTNILTFDHFSDSEDDLISSIDDPIFEPAGDEFDDQVEEAQRQLEELRIQQEAIEAQKAEIERLRLKQAEFQRGRVEMIENLQHALDVLDRDREDAEHRLELFTGARESFAKHLDALANIRPEGWERDELSDELDIACHCVDEARNDFDGTLARLDTLGDRPAELQTFAPVAAPPALSDDVAALAEPASVAAGEARDFRYWMRSGFAFTLPMMLFGCFAIMLVLLFG